MPNFSGVVFLNKIFGKVTKGAFLFRKNPNPDFESKNGFFVSLAKSKKGL